MKFIEEKQLLCLCLIAVICSSSLSQNLIIDGNFTSPQIPPFMTDQIFTRLEQGWKCNYYFLIYDCQRLMDAMAKRNMMAPLCSGRIASLNTVGINLKITQNLNLKVGSYKITFVYFLPSLNANKKRMLVKFNENIILQVHPRMNGISQGIYFDIDIEAKDGDNQLAFEALGYSLDNIGFKIGNVSAFRILDSSSQTLVKNAFQFEFLSKMSALPGGRVFFGSLLGFLINLDRYQLYAYHHRNYSYNAQRLIQQIGNLQNQKGILFRKEIQESLNKVIESQRKFFENMYIKKDYFDYKYLQKANLTSFLRDYLTFNFPIVLVIYCLLHCSFLLLHKWRLSLFFRQYAFHAILLFALTEGNLEEITFHCFAELRFLFSRSISHKLFNCCAISVLFAVVFICFAFYLWLKVHYAKKAKIVADVENATLSALISVGFDRGVMMFLFGVTHQLLLSTPTVQMAILVSLEALWILKRIYSRKHYRHTALFAVILLDSLLRLYFQVTTLIYDLISKHKLIINEKHHKNFFYILVASIAFQISLSIFYFVLKWFHSYSKYSSKIKPIPNINDIITAINSLPLPKVDPTQSKILANLKETNIPSKNSQIKYFKRRIKLIRCQ